MAIAQLVAENPALARQSEILSRPMTPLRRMADAVRVLALDAVEAAQSGHSGLPMGMADAATVLFSRFLKFDAADPKWPDRDRFVLSAGHGAMLLYALIHLTGHAGMTIEDLQSFRQLHSPATGHPEFGEHPAIEVTSGPLGQGFAAAVGMALAERHLAARFGKSLVDHRTWVIASDGDLMEGISHEAAALAGHLCLNRLTVIYDDNSVSMDGATALSCSEDVLKRFAAYGWATKRVDGHDASAIGSALSFAMRSKKPTLIACRTIIGLGSPRNAGSAMSHGKPLGREEAAAARAAMRWMRRPFDIPEDLADRWQAVGARGASARRSWLKRLARHSQAREFERAMAGRLPDSWHEAVAVLKAQIADTRPCQPTRSASQTCLEALVPATPELVGGSADLTASNLTQAPGMAPMAPGSFGGRYIHYGVREHAMAAAANGLALHGGIIPYTGTFLAFSDYMRPAIRLGAIMRQRAILVLTHDSIGVGADGPTHQPVEHLASFRAMPNVHVFRPADALETAECWELAIRRTEGPSLLVLTRQAVPALRSDPADNRCARGGYVLAEADGPRLATVIATGSEVCIAMTAREILAGEGIGVAVVSLPCWELFERQDEAWRSAVLGGPVRVGIEAAGGFGWERWLGSDGTFIGMPGYGASASQEDLYRHFGITAEAVVAAVKKKIA
jgi:transketolase